MKAKEIGRIGTELKRFMREFSECFGRREPSEHAQVYVRSQLSNLPRKSMEPMADQAGIEPRALQKFLSLHQWDDEKMTYQTHAIVARDHAHPNSIGIIDETSFVKKGAKTPGVQRQHCGATGKKDNCTVTVHLGYATPEFHCLLSGALFLPESWSVNRVRCREAGIPDELVHRPKWQIALELHQQALNYGVSTKWLTADEDYGKAVEFHLELSRREQLYVVEVSVNFWAWGRQPKVLTGKSGPRLDGHAHISTVQDLAKYSWTFVSLDWQPFYVKDGTKGPIVWEVKAAPIYLKNADGLPTSAHWLIIARNALDHEEMKYFVSNAPQDTPLTMLLHVAFSRWHIERCFEDEKTELGLKHFEVRTYCAMMRHLALTAVSHLFVARVHQKLKKNPQSDGLSGAHGGERLFDGAGQTRQAAAQVSGACIGDHYSDTIAQRQIRTKSPEGNIEALAPDRDLYFSTAAL